VEILAAPLADDVAKGKVVRDVDRIYLRELFEAEVRVADKIRAMRRTPASFRPINVDKAVPWAAAHMNITFEPLQAEALETALSSKVAIITGGPGVGKTTIIRALVDVFKARKLSVALAAPTGRAAKRMEEAAGHKAMTIHRLLKYIPATGRFTYCADSPLKAHVCMVDEVSMIDIMLMSHLLAALPDRGCLVLVGDADQLPSVGPGNVLRDMIHSGAVPCVKLEKIFRQKVGGAIVRNAHRVNRGEFLELSGREALSDFYFIQAEDPDVVIERMLSLVTDRIPRRFGFSPLNDIQVLTPMRRNQLGSDNLNALLQQALNPAGVEVQRFARKYRTGDRVMQIRNNYDKEVFNGDVGRIVRIDPEEQQVVVNMYGRRMEYRFSELDELVHAYACSIHKAQGSEYPAVVVLLATQHFKLLQRNLLYTAITRGKRLVCMVGTRKAVHIAIGNNDIRLRRTGLRARLHAE
jgi:exodeoxyribonuclease V alpha subunit